MSRKGTESVRRKGGDCRKEKIKVHRKGEFKWRIGVCKAKQKYCTVCVTRNWTVCEEVGVENICDKENE
jgi:hypothetical protein